MPELASGSWYAVQVLAGSEERTCRLVEQVAEERAIREVFVPRYTDSVYDKKAKAWSSVDRVLFPGYLIVVSKSPEAVSNTLLGIRESQMVRALGDMGGPVPLSDDEVAFIDGFTHRGHRVVPQSQGYIAEGGRVVITEGPLVGREALIVRVKHRQNRAVLSLGFCGRDVLAEVGLHVVRGERSRKANAG